MLRNLKIRTKLLVSAVLVVLLVALIGGIGIRGTQIINEAFRKIIQSNLPALKALLEIGSVVNEIEAQTIGMEILSQDRTVVEGTLGGSEKLKVLANMEKIQDLLDKYKLHAVQNVQKEYIQQIDQAKEEVILAAVEFIHKSEEGVSYQEKIDQKLLLEEARTHLKEAVARGVQYEAVEFEKRKQFTDQTVVQTIKTVATISVIGLILAIGIGVMLYKSIAGPILALRQASLDISRGEGGVKVDVSSKDELGDLAVSFNKMTESLQQAQTQLLQSEKMASIGQLAAGIAHEINNPVGFINSNLQSFDGYWKNLDRIFGNIKKLRGINVKEEKDRDEVNRIVEGIKSVADEINLDFIVSDAGSLIRESLEGTERIRKIVLDLRTFARKNNDTLELVKIETVIDGVLSIMHSEMKYKTELKKNYGDVPDILCNPQRLGQVFINLFVNAVQSIPEKGIVEVKTYLQDGQVCIDVRDTGCGIEEKNLAKIFDAFFTTKPVGSGTGLGLSVSYDIVKKHGGDIKVQSKVGEGTTFTVLLPVKQQ